MNDVPCPPQPRRGAAGPQRPQPPAPLLPGGGSAGHELFVTEEGRQRADGVPEGWEKAPARRGGPALPSVLTWAPGHLGSGPANANPDPKTTAAAVSQE